MKIGSRSPCLWPTPPSMLRRRKSKKIFHVRRMVLPVPSSVQCSLPNIGRVLNVVYAANERNIQAMENAIIATALKIVIKPI